MAHIKLINLLEAISPDRKIWKLSYAFPIIIRQLEKTNHTFEIVDRHIDLLTIDQIIQNCSVDSGMIYGISAYSCHYADAVRLISGIRDKKRDAIIIVGGLLAQNDDVLMRCTAANIVVTAAEGEFVLPEILSALDRGYEHLNNVAGITYRCVDGTIRKTDTRPTMTNDEFENMEMPAYEYFDRALYEIAKNVNSQSDVPVKAFHLLTTRGCPFQCTFCGHLYGNKLLRKSWRRFFDEIEYLHKKYGFVGFFSYDQNMFLAESEIQEYCNEYARRKLPVHLLIELRPTFGSPEMFEKLYNHGVRVILFGLESGSQRMLDRMKKGFNLRKVQQTIAWAMEAGIIIHGNFIFGTPGENKESVHQTAQYMLYLEKLISDQHRRFRKAQKLCTSGYGRSFFVPSPPSSLYRTAVAQGYIKDEEAYLRNLSAEKNLKLLKNSKLKISLAEVGGDVNMSEFSSRESLVHYVKCIWALVKMRAALYYDGSIRKKIYCIVEQGINSLVEYVLYITTRVRDYLWRIPRRK